MGLTQMLEQLEEKGYTFIYKASTAFPYSNDLMHIGLIGALPYFVGRYGSEFIARRMTNPINAETLRRCAPAIGFSCAGIAEGIWAGVLEPRSRYGPPGDWQGDLVGMGETLLGTGAAFGLDTAVRHFKERK